jgi:hypothetical protein
VASGNLEEVRRHLAPLFVFSSPDGVRDRDAYLQRLAQRHIRSYTIADITSKPNGADWVVSYRLTLQDAGSEARLPAEPLRVMTVWQQAHGSWIAIAQSVTPEARATPAHP